MTTLNDVREFILYKSKEPGKLLMLADKYLMDIDEMGTEFRLSREHVNLKPILEEFGSDHDAYLEFIRGIHESMPSRSEVRKAVYEVYRTIGNRLAQRRRRVLLDAAVGMAVKKGLIPDVYTVKLQYANRCTAAWALRKKNLLDAHRATEKHVDVDTRRVLLDEFWKQIMNEINNGEVPKP